MIDITMSKQTQNEVKYKMSKLTPYLLAFLDINKKDICVSGFVSCFLRCEFDKNPYNEFNKRVYVVYNKHKLTTGVLEYLSNQEQFIKSLYLEDVIILVYKPLDEYFMDFQKVQYGKYSLLSEGFKMRLLNMYCVKDSVLDTTSGIFKTLYPSLKDKQSVATKYGVRVEDIKEIRSTPNLIKETFYESTLFKMDLGL
jgi:adenine C2-methylase RlmN of 23S rRNA A2503 and tRNA A37